MGRHRGPDRHGPVPARQAELTGSAWAQDANYGNATVSVKLPTTTVTLTRAPAALEDRPGGRGVGDEFDLQRLGGPLLFIGSKISHYVLFSRLSRGVAFDSEGAG